MEHYENLSKKALIGSAKKQKPGKFRAFLPVLRLRSEVLGLDTWEESPTVHFDQLSCNERGNIRS